MVSSFRRLGEVSCLMLTYALHSSPHEYVARQPTHSTASVWIFVVCC